MVPPPCWEVPPSDVTFDALDSSDLSDDVHHAGDGVGAIDGRGAVLQDLDLVNRIHRQGIEVGEGAFAIVRQRIVRGAMTVDQDQRVGAGQAAQRHGRAPVAKAPLKASDRLPELSAEIERTTSAVEVRPPAWMSLSADHLDRRRRLQVIPADQGAGDHHGFKRVAMSWLVGLRQVGRSGRRLPRPLPPEAAMRAVY